LASLARIMILKRRCTNSFAWIASANCSNGFLLLIGKRHCSLNNSFSMLFVRMCCRLQEIHGSHPHVGHEGVINQFSNETASDESFPRATVVRLASMSVTMVKLQPVGDVKNEVNTRAPTNAPSRALSCFHHSPQSLHV